MCLHLSSCLYWKESKLFLSGLLGPNFPVECSPGPPPCGGLPLVGISGLLQSYRQPLPPVSIPPGLVIKSLIIHHYSNHYLPFPGPQCWLRGIQSGNCTTPPPPKPTHSNILPDSWHRPHLPSLCHQKKDTKLYYTLAFHSHRHTWILWTLTIDPMKMRIA